MSFVSKTDLDNDFPKLATVRRNTPAVCEKCKKRYLSEKVKEKWKSNIIKNGSKIKI